MIKIIIIFFVIWFIITFLFKKKSYFAVSDSLTRKNKENYFRCILNNDQNYCDSIFSRRSDPKMDFGHLEDSNGIKYKLYRNCNKMNSDINYYYRIKTANNKGYVHKKIENRIGDIYNGNTYDIDGLGTVTAYIPNDNIINCRNNSYNPYLRDNQYRRDYDIKYYQRHHTSLDDRYNLNEEILHDDLYEYPLKNYIHPNDYPYHHNYTRDHIFHSGNPLYNNPRYYYSDDILYSNSTPIVDNLRRHMGTIKDGADNYYLLYRDRHSSNEYRYYIKDSDGFEKTIEILNSNEDIYDGHLFNDDANTEYTFNQDLDSYEKID